MRSTILVMCLAASAALLAACSSPAPETYGVTSSALEKGTAVREILGRVGMLAEDSIYSCILNSVVQGVPLAQAQEDCATKLIDDDKLGFGGPLGEITGQNQQFFDPKSVSGACGSGDPALGKRPTYENYPLHGEFSHGGEENNEYRGLDRATSLAQKEAAADAYIDALEKLIEAQAEEKAARERAEAAAKTGDAAVAEAAAAAAKEAEEKTNKQREAAEAASRKAKEDPNRKPVLQAQTVQGASPCEQALQAARELLRECQRTGWKNHQCQQLLSSMNGCPDPALILVDPEQGYTCAGKPDPEAVKKAVVARCEQRVKYGPDGANPCEAPSLDAGARLMKGQVGDVCDDPQAYRDPGSDACLGTFAPGGYLGQPDIQQIIIVAMEKLGGPMIVIAPPKPPGGGPEPRPL